jgi:hypothetical protein
MMLASLGIAGRAFAAYLTLPVLLLGAAGIGVLLAAGRRRCVLYLALWEAILLAPACAFAYGYFPRYALPAAIPILLAAAHGAAFLWAGLAGAVRSGAARTLLATALTVLAVGPSIRDDLRGIRSWRDWPLLPVDRGQFVSGSPAGFATEAAAGWLREAAAAREGPVTVLTPEISGNPTDGVWLLLDGDPRIRLSYAPDALRQPLLPPAGADGARRLPGDARDPRPAPVVVSPGETVFAVAPDPLITRSGWVRAAEFLARSNPGLVEAARFANPVTPGIPPSAVVVLRLPEPSH